MYQCRHVEGDIVVGGLPLNGEVAVDARVEVDGIERVGHLLLVGLPLSAVYFRS